MVPDTPVCFVMHLFFPTLSVSLYFILYKVKSAFRNDLAAKTSRSILQLLFLLVLFYTVRRLKVKLIKTHNLFHITVDTCDIVSVHATGFFILNPLASIVSGTLLILL